MTGEERSSLRKPGGTFLVFETTHLTMKAESILNEAGIPHRLFPKPRSVVSECGLVVKVLESDLRDAVDTCEKSGVKVKEFVTLSKSKVE